MPVVGARVESTQLDFVTGSPTTETFRVGTVSSMCRRLLVTTTTDCYLHFDADADDTCFVLQAGCPMEIDNVSFTTISARGVTAAGTLYILAVRD